MYNYSLKWRKKTKKIIPTCQQHLFLQKQKQKQEPLKEVDRENAQCSKFQVMSLFPGHTEYSASQLSFLGYQSWLQQETEDTLKLVLSNEV